jgi:hypothetical protein
MSEESLPPSTGYFENNISGIMGAHPIATNRYRYILEGAYDISPSLPPRPESIHRVPDDLAINSRTPSKRSTSEETQKTLGQSLAREASQYFERYQNQGNGNYYPELQESIATLHKLQAEHRAYITEANPQEKPVSYLHLIEKIQEPMPFQSFTKFHSQSTISPTDKYLELETSVLNTIYKVVLSPTTAEQETENYELHQHRIRNTLKTINKSELNLRLAFINLYLQASASRIKQEAAPMEKEALLNETVRFLNANLISPKPDSFSSEDEATKYASLFLQTIAHIKGINEEFPQNNTSMFKISDGDNPVNSLYFLKNSLINKILEQSNDLITVNNLPLNSKKLFMSHWSLKSILGENLMVELKNRTLKTILEQEESSNPNSGNPNSFNLFKKTLGEEILTFINRQNVQDRNYNQKYFFDMILIKLKEFNNDRSLFFQFLNQMIEKTTEMFTKFQDTETSNDNNNQFNEFKNLLLDHLEQPSDLSSQNMLAHITMGKSLLKLMQFKDDDIKAAAKAFYLKAIKEAKYISCLNSFLEPLFLIAKEHSKKSSVSVYDLFSLTRGDLTEHLQENPLIKINRLEKMLKEPTKDEPTEDERTLLRYTKILDISPFLN